MGFLQLIFNICLEMHCGHRIWDKIKCHFQQYRNRPEGLSPGFFSEPSHLWFWSILDTLTTSLLTSGQPDPSSNDRDTSFIFCHFKVATDCGAALKAACPEPANRRAWDRSPNGRDCLPLVDFPTRIPSVRYRCNIQLNPVLTKLKGQANCFFRSGFC